MDCPCCDGLGMIDDPLRPGCVKLAAWLDPLDDEDRAAFAADAERRDAARRAEELACAEHAASAPADCPCRWCTVQPRTEG
jgi:hypothetical protein